MAERDDLVDPLLGPRILAAVQLHRYELRIERAIKASLARQRIDTFATLDVQSLTAAAPPDPFDLPSWDRRVTDEVLPVINDTLGEVASKTLGFLQLPPEIRTRLLGVIDVASRALTFAAVVRTIGTKLAAQVVEELSIGVAKGEGARDLTTRVAERFRIADGTAARIARTETHGAAEATKHESALAVANAGFEMTHTWIATADARTRHTHRLAEEEGVAIPLDQPFRVGEAFLKFPGDPDGPVEEVANCRCAEIFGMRTDDKDLPSDERNSAGPSTG